MTSVAVWRLILYYVQSYKHTFKIRMHFTCHKSKRGQTMNWQNVVETAGLLLLATGTIQAAKKSGKYH